MIPFCLEFGIRPFQDCLRLMFTLYLVQPNCYSRVITVCGDEHIMIFAKRDIKQWEELTYDYRSDL